MLIFKHGRGQFRHPTSSLFTPASCQVLEGEHRLVFLVVKCFIHLLAGGGQVDNQLPAAGCAICVCIFSVYVCIFTWACKRGSAETASSTSTPSMTCFFTYLPVSLSSSADCWPEPHKALSVLTDTAPPGCQAQRLRSGTARPGPVPDGCGTSPKPRQVTPSPPPPPLSSA